MRFGVAAVLVLLLGAFGAHFLLADRGYVLGNFAGYVVEMSVPGLVIVLVLAYLFVRALVGLAGAPRRWREAREKADVKRRARDLAAGFAALVEGNWARSERLLTQGLRRADAPLANYLLAAHAAHLQGAVDRRNQWLELAEGLSAEGVLCAKLTRAELELAAGDAAAALATLKTLGSAEQPSAIALLARAHRALGDRQGLFGLLSRLPRASLPAHEREEVVRLAVAGELARPELTAERLAELTAALPGELRSSPAFVVERARALARLGRGDEAERELRTALKRDWQAALVACYGEVRATDAAAQLRQAESWLEAHSGDATLLLAAGRLALANELWGKARSYLESSLALAPTPEAYALYGELLSALGEQERALAALRAGLSLASPAAAAEVEPRVRALPRALERKAEGE
jgi:HemY protein